MMTNEKKQPAYVVYASHTIVEINGAFIRECRAKNGFT